MDDVYQPPQSDLNQEEPDDTSEYGSLEKGINGDYELDFNEILNTSWRLTSGFKGSFFGAFFLYYLVYIVLMIVLSLIGRSISSGAGAIIFAIFNMLAMVVVTYPMLAGIMVMGVNRSVARDVSFKDVFQYFDKAITVTITVVLGSILFLLGFICFVLPGIYLGISYLLALPLVCEKDLSPWEALETSRKAITHNWFTIFGITIAFGFIMMLSAIPLGIGLIWTLPMGYIVLGVVYRDIFGVEPA